MPSVVETRAQVHAPHFSPQWSTNDGGGGGVDDGSSGVGNNKMNAATNGTKEASAAPLLQATHELDQLLDGMLMNVQNMPDVRPASRRHLHQDIDVDSIQVSALLSHQLSKAIALITLLVLFGLL